MAKQWNIQAISDAYSLITAAGQGDVTARDQLDTLRQHARAGDAAAIATWDLMNHVAELAAHYEGQPVVIGASPVVRVRRPDGKIVTYKRDKNLHNQLTKELRNHPGARVLDSSPGFPVLKAAQPMGTPTMAQQTAARLAAQRSQYGQPQYGQPQYGQPQMGPAQYMQPQGYGQPQMMYGQPQMMYGQNQYMAADQSYPPGYGMPQDQGPDDDGGYGPDEEFPEVGGGLTPNAKLNQRVEMIKAQGKKALDELKRRNADILKDMGFKQTIKNMQNATQMNMRTIQQQAQLTSLKHQQQLKDLTVAQQATLRAMNQAQREQAVRQGIITSMDAKRLAEGDQAQDEIDALASQLQKREEEAKIRAALDEQAAAYEKAGKPAPEPTVEVDDENDPGGDVSFEG